MGYGVENCGRRTPGSASTDSKISGTVFLLVNAGTHTLQRLLGRLPLTARSLPYLPPLTTHYAPVESPSIGSRRVRRTTPIFSICVGSFRSCHIDFRTRSGKARPASLLTEVRTLHLTFEITHQTSTTTTTTTPSTRIFIFPCTRIPTAASTEPAAHRSPRNAFANSNCRCSPVLGTTVTPRNRDHLPCDLILPPNLVRHRTSSRASLHLHLHAIHPLIHYFLASHRISRLPRLHTVDLNGESRRRARG